VPREGAFDYTVRARCAAADAVALLSDFTRHCELHPLIVSVREETAAPGALRSFAITDRLRWGPLTVPITYHADVLVADPDEVVTVARQSPRTTVRNHTRLRTGPDGTVVIDVRITLTAPSPLFRYAFRQARAAHAELAERLRVALEAQPA
jgi:hypothetical protein